MTFFDRWIDAWSVRNRALMRIADALERIAPAVEEPAEDLKPEDAVQYVDEQAIARQEQIDQAGELARWMAEEEAGEA